MPFPNEAEYRQNVQSTFGVIEAAFADVDPDLAECEQALGAMTITLADQSRCILSSQPSVQQIWLALASRGTAYHFDYDVQRAVWIDDKGRGIELISFLEEFLKEATSRPFSIRGKAGGKQL